MMIRPALALYGLLALLPLSAGALPDLVVTAISFSRTQEHGSHSYAFQATIRNAGDSPTPDGVIHGVSFWVDGQAVAWHDASTAPLGPGQERVVTSTGGPQGRNWHDFGGPGTWQIMAWVDDVSRIEESNTGNNQRRTSLTLTAAGERALPDLVVVDLVAGGRVRNFSAIATVRNVGQSPTPEGVPITVFFTFGAGETRVNDVTMGPLHPGQEIQVLSSSLEAGSPPFMGAPDLGQASAHVDHLNRIDESNEENNVLSVELKQDIVIQRILVEPANPKEGEQVRFGAELTNEGNFWNDFVNSRVFFLVDGELATWFSHPGFFPLMPGDSAIHWANGYVDDLAQVETPQYWIAVAGTHELKAVVQETITFDPQNTGNSASTTIHVAGGQGPLPDLTVTGIALNRLEDDGSPHRYTFQATIRNVGEGPTPEGTIHGVSFWVNGQAVAWHDASTASLGPGQDRVVASTGGPEGRNWHDFGGPGSWDIMAWVDDVGRISESDVENNRHAIGFMIEGPLAINREPSSKTVHVGGTATLDVGATGTGGVNFQWQKNGRDIDGASGSTLEIANAQPRDAGIYTVRVTDGSGAVSSRPVILGISTIEKFAGAGHSPAHFQDILHPNGNIYDQVLLTGEAATITADPGKVTRISFIDLNQDIVQVEFSGSGSLTVTLAGASGPALPENYNQDVQYVRGHPTIVVQGAGPDTYVAAFSVGRANAINQDLFREGVNYDGIADLARLAIHSPAGQAASVLMGNGHFFDTAGLTGVFAPGVLLSGSLRIYDITAFDGAEPALILGSAPNGITITGGTLQQDNNRPIRIEGVNQVIMSAGTDSHGNFQPPRLVAGQLFHEGTDVTQQVVVNP